VFSAEPAGQGTIYVGGVADAVAFEVEPLLRRDGVVVLHIGETEAGFARLLADELFRGQHVGTVVCSLDL
jgi:hypothetical protein